MNFTSARMVVSTINAGREVEVIRGQNRVKVNNLFNGVPPLNESEAKQWNLRINVNWGEGAVLAAHARRQYTNAFLRPARCFRISIPLAPPDKRTEWEHFIGTYINRVLKNSREWFYLKQNQFASVVAHGIGPQLWEDRESWLPRFVAIDDLRVATDTQISFSNLEWFAVRHWYTEGELSAKVFNPHSKHWNKTAIATILHTYRDRNYENVDYTWMTAPEKMAELVKQNGGYYSSDAVPSIPLWHFYHKDVKDGKESWMMKVVPDVDDGGTGIPKDEFLYDSKKVYANDLSEILNVQFGDLNNKPPFLYHSVRSLGFLLVEPCFFTNLARCRTLQHLFESMNVWLRVSDPTGRARAQKAEFFDRCIVEEGVEIVPQNQRHQVDANLIEMCMSQLRQLMSEASASYTQETDTGTSKEQTAYETSVKVAQVNAMLGGMLLVAFFQEKFAYREICRRFCIKNSEDADVKEFQEMARERGIPQRFLNVKYWDIDPEMPLGAGNPTMEIAEAQQLMNIRPLLNPTAQQEALHMYVATVFDPSRADQLVPMDKNKELSNSQKWASAIFGTLMQGVLVPVNENLPPADQIETLLGMMSGVIWRLEQDQNMATQSELLGLFTVSQYIQILIQQIQQDPFLGPRASEYAKSLGELMNIMKGFQQRLQKQQEAQNDPSAQAKAQATMLQATVKAQTHQASAEQKMDLKNKAFIDEQARKNIAFAQEQHRKGVELGAQAVRDDFVAKREEEAAAAAPQS